MTSGGGIAERPPVSPPIPTRKYPSINDPQLQMRIVAVQGAKEARNQGGAPSQEVEDSVVDVRNTPDLQHPDGGRVAEDQRGGPRICPQV